MSSSIKKKGSLRLCTMTGCSSGTYSERRSKAESGLRQTTIFTPPFNKPALLEKWSSIIGRPLVAKDRVCELHFEEKFVIKSDYTHLPDGTIFSLPRLKYRLAPGAVPFKFLKKIGNDQIDEQGKENQTIDADPFALDETKEGFLDDHQYSISTDKTSQYVYYNKEVAACFMIPSIKDTLIKRKKELTETNCINDHVNNDDTIDDQKDGVNDPLDDTNDSIYDNTVDETLNDDNNDETNSEIMEFEEVLNESEIMPKPKLKMQEIMDYLLETALPKTWSWMNYTKNDSGVTFTQIDCKSRRVRCFIEVHEDLSIMLHTGDDRVSLEIEFQLSSVESILRMLQTVVRMKICSGTGIEKECRDEDCTGVIIPTEEYKSARSLDRCVACRKLRIKIMHARDTKDINVKYLKLKKQYDQLRKKSRYLEEKLDIKTTKLKAITEMIKSVNKYGKNYQLES